MAVGRLKTNVMGCGCCAEANRRCQITHPLEAVEPWNTDFVPYDDNWIWSNRNVGYFPSIAELDAPEYEITSKQFLTRNPDHTRPNATVINIARTLDMFDEVGTYLQFRCDFLFDFGHYYVVNTPLFSFGTYDKISFNELLFFRNASGVRTFSESPITRGWLSDSWHRMEAIVTRTGIELEYECVFWIDDVPEYITTSYGIQADRFGCNKTFEVLGWHPFVINKAMAVRNFNLAGEFNAVL